MTIRALIAGAGSIGNRHRDVLAELGCDVATVSRRGAAEFASLTEGVARFRPTYVVIATETGNHHDLLCELAAAGFDGTVMVEKPLFERVRDMPANRFAGCFVAYNLRFHPVLVALRDRVSREQVLFCRCEVGQHLSSWRPGRDHRSTYSARAGEGGVLRDLSHEIDYVSWLFGAATAVTALVSSSGALGIASDDSAAILMKLDRCPSAQVGLDYHQRPATRTVTAVTADHTYRADLVAQTLLCDGEPIAVGAVPVDRNHTYRAMHQAALAGSGPTTLDEGLATMRVIEAAEAASRELCWRTP